MFLSSSSGFSISFSKLRYILVLAFLFLIIYNYLPHPYDQSRLVRTPSSGRPESTKQEVFEPGFSEPDSAKSTAPDVIRPGDVPVPKNIYDADLDKEEPPPFEPGGQVGTLRNVREDGFYRGGTLSLTTSDGSEGNGKHPTPSIYDPYPDYNSDQWKESWLGSFSPCKGPRGVDLDRRNPVDMMLAYPGNQKDFPRAQFGGYDTLGLDGQVCTDRYSRYGAYGYGASHDPDTPGFTRPPRVFWNQVDWKDLQTQCFERNAERYKTASTKGYKTLPLPGDLSTDVPKKSPTDPTFSSSQPQHKPRSAVILRAWHDLNWTPSLKSYVRSIIMELSLHSGAEYEIFILVHVKDDIPDELNDATVRRLRRNIPPEFRNMAVFFNDRVLRDWYPNIEEHKPIYQHFQPLQIFSQAFSNFDYYWQVEVDSRQTGHMYHFFDRAIEFAKEQPRKQLWERNAYFYSRDAHGPWDRFVSTVNESMVDRTSVWGPVKPFPLEGRRPIGPKPPVADPSSDDFEWGVGEEADMITFLPIFDPAATEWTFPHMLYNLPPDTPRRAAVITMGRFSKRLLDEMHMAQERDHVGLVSEMTPASFSLWHGLKAVYVPHPMHADGKWTAKELARIMNKGKPDKINGGPDSAWNFNHELDHIFFRISYMYTTQTAEDLFRRWMGYNVDPNQYYEDVPHQDPLGRNWFDSGDLREDLYGRLCYPPILLHTIKNAEEEKEGSIPGLA